MSIENTEVKSQNLSEANTLKGYRNLNDIENFYRFVYDNKVRNEAHMIFQAIIDVVAPKKKARKPRAKRSKKVN